MKIDVLCGSGSTSGVTLSDLRGNNGRLGVGGSEYALLTFCEALTKRGDEVVIYNSPKTQDDVIEHRSVASFDKHADRDILIVFREPTRAAIGAKGKRVFWSCDQYTVGDYRDFSRHVDRVVTISPYHEKYFKEKYHIDSTPIDLPVRTWEYDDNIEKVDKRMIFTSVPDRGLDVVIRTFPEISRRVPGASLVVTSDYRLWGSADPHNARFLTRFISMGNVTYLGGVKRERLVEEQKKAQIHYYPFNGQTEELFCVAVAESQVAGVLPITSTDGALETTNMGVLIYARWKPNSF